MSTAKGLSKERLQINETSVPVASTAPRALKLNTLEARGHRTASLRSAENPQVKKKKQNTFRLQKWDSQQEELGRTSGPQGPRRNEREGPGPRVCVGSGVETLSRVKMNEILHNRKSWSVPVATGSISDIDETDQDYLQQPAVCSLEPIEQRICRQVPSKVATATFALHNGSGALSSESCRGWHRSAKGVRCRLDQTTQEPCHRRYQNVSVRDAAREKQWWCDRVHPPHILAASGGHRPPVPRDKTSCLQSLSGAPKTNESQRWERRPRKRPSRRRS